MDALIEKYALANALKYEGKANAGNIIGQIVRENPAAKGYIKDIQAKAAAIVQAVNKLSLEEQRERLEKLAPELLEKKEHKEHDLYAFLQIPDDFVVNTGWPPEPGKHLHIGHAKAALANYELARRYGGRFVLRFDDTNAEKVKKEFYDIIVADLHWLGIEPDKVDVGSERLDDLYVIADKLIAAGHCYVCDCPAEAVNQQRYSGQPDIHRDQPLAETQERWRSLREGEVLRLRTASDHKNSAMRDPTLFRVSMEPHPRVGTRYTKWPTYDFETCLLDALEGLTHRLRTKEFELRTELHNHLQKLAGFAPTTYYEFGRFGMEGVDTQGRVVREKIASGHYVGWDDPALATLGALRRRGFTPQAIRNFVLSTGLTKNDATLTWDDLYVHNRRVLNDTAKRLFFVASPQRVHVENAPGKRVHLHYFPQHKDAQRIFEAKADFWLAHDDLIAMPPGGLYRLMDGYNITRTAQNAFAYVGDDLEAYRASGQRIVHFLPLEHDAVAVDVLFPDKTLVEGLGESRVRELHVGEMVQFERFGFCRLDSVERTGTQPRYHFWFTHK